MEITRVIEIQVGGSTIVQSLEEACIEYIRMLQQDRVSRTKISFAIKTKDGQVKAITIRDEDNETVAYGDFEGLLDALAYASAVTGREIPG